MPDSSKSETLRFLYTFEFPDGTEKKFEVLLSAKTLELVTKNDLPKPAWTKLKYQQCEHCPLGDEHEYCPVAVNLSALVESFKDSVSYESTNVRVQTNERIYEKKTTLQKGLSSIIGMYMVTSDCPVMDKLRPMVRFHLPFGSLEETVYRAASMYLTAQYLLMRKGKTPDWDLKKLVEIYKSVGHVNRGISNRLSSASEEDANMNAVVILSAYAEMVPFSIEHQLAELEYIFSEYTKFE
ncbi:MAG: hypothetical protein E6K64_10660 [Nitrospirae bacterium]|nr:MAG: hypothetical protein E6K64_10660 [Nitrospirota bacterium]